MTSLAPQKDLEPDRATPAESRVNGVYDMPSPGRISGWAIDRSDPDASVEVEVCREGALVCRVRADRHRPDLERGGLGTGRYGFSVDLDPPVPPEMVFTLSVRAVTADGASGPLRATGEAAPNDDPLLRLVERGFDQTAALRAEVAALADALKARPAPTDTAATTAILERIEVVQARLDGVAAGGEAPADPAVGPGLRLAIAAALAMSMVAVLLGVWSVLT